MSDDMGYQIQNAVRSTEPYRFSRILLPSGRYTLKAAAVDYADNMSISSKHIEIRPAAATASCASTRIRKDTAPRRRPRVPVRR